MSRLLQGCRLPSHRSCLDLVTKDDFIFILGRLSFAQKEPDGNIMEDTELCLQIVLRRLFPCMLKGLVGAPGGVRF